MSFNRNIPLVIAAGVGIMSGFYIWEPMFKKYQRESKGTWQYEVVQQTREEERNRVADAAASSLANNTSTPSTATTSTPSTAPESSSPSVTPSSEASPSASA